MVADYKKYGRGIFLLRTDSTVFFTVSKEKAGIRAFENEFYNIEKGTGVWTQDFERTVSELYIDSGVKIFKTTNTDKTTWLEIKPK